MDKEVYHITGKVTDGSVALEGVEVSTSGKSAKTAADGTYQLAMDKIGTYVVTFAKEGYVTVSADAVILSSTPKHSAVALSQILTSLAASVPYRLKRKWLYMMSVRMWQNCISQSERFQKIPRSR